MNGEIEALARAEVEALHAFFEGWLTGALPAEVRVFERVERALAPEFEIVGPDGRRLPRAELLLRLRGARESRAVPPLSIQVRELRVRPLGPEHCLALYEEWHEHAGRARGRAASAVLRRRAELDAGIEWVHVHETWLPEA